MAEQAQDQKKEQRCDGVEQFSATAFVRGDILEKARELADAIASSEEVQVYRKAEKMIQDNARIQETIRTIKKKQKEAVAFESFKNQEMVKKIEDEIDVLERHLDEIPIVGQFKQTQSDINYLLQLVITVVRDTVSEKISVESGADMPSSGE